MTIVAEGIRVLIDFGDPGSPFVTITGTCTRCAAELFNGIADARDHDVMDRVSAMARADRATFDAHRCALRDPP